MRLRVYRACGREESLMQSVPELARVQVKWCPKQHVADSVEKSILLLLISAAIHCELQSAWPLTAALPPRASARHGSVLIKHDGGPAGQCYDRLMIAQ